MTGYDNAYDVAGRILREFRAEWQYESDKKNAVASIAQALQDAYEIGMSENRGIE